MMETVSWIGLVVVLTLFVAAFWPLFRDDSKGMTTEEVQDSWAGKHR